MRNRIAKWLKWTAFLAGILTAVTMFYGFFSYPYAPIRQVGEKFQDKRGTVYSEREFLNFKLWERCFLVFGASTFILAFGGQLLSFKPKAKNSAQT